jgi:ribonuclease HI
MFQQRLFDYSADSESQIQVYFDGRCQPCNPGGVACYAFIVKNRDYTIYKKYGRGGNNSTNNVAEYTGIIETLQWLLANNYENENILVRGDSLLVINQVKGKYEVSSPNLVPLYHQVRSLVSKFNHVEFEWIPRAENKEADKLSSRAYEEIMCQESSWEIRYEQTSL